MAQLGRALAWSFGADVLEVGVIALCLKSLGLSAGLTTSLLVFAAVNLAIAVPSTPANLGALEAGAALALVATGVAHDAAVAFALLYRAVQWLPITLAGGAIWAWRAAGASRVRLSRRAAGQRTASRSRALGNAIEEGRRPGGPGH